MRHHHHVIDLQFRLHLVLHHYHDWDVVYYDIDNCHDHDTNLPCDIFACPHHDYEYDDDNIVTVYNPDHPRHDDNGSPVVY